MYLAYSSNGFTRVDLPAALRGIAAAGFRGAELLFDRPHFTPADLTGEGLARLRGVLRETGLRVSNINANTAVALWPAPPPEPVFEPSLSNVDASVRAKRLAYSRAAVDLAVAVGAGCVSVTSGRTQAHVPPEDGFACFAEALGELCDYADARGVRIGIEYEPALLCERATEVAAVIGAVGHRALGVNLDLGHALCAGEDPVESIALLAGRIWNVHLEDIRGGKHHHRIPGDGDVDFRRLLLALRAHGYDGPLTVELYTCSDIADEAATRAHAHLAPLLNALDPESP